MEQTVEPFKAAYSDGTFERYNQTSMKEESNSNRIELICNRKDNLVRFAHSYKRNFRLSGKVLGSNMQSL